MKTSRAWAIKEAFLNFWDYLYLASARKYFQRWYFWATHSRLKPIIKVAKTMIAAGLMYFFENFDGSSITPIVNMMRMILGLIK